MSVLKGQMNAMQMPFVKILPSHTNACVNQVILEKGKHVKTLMNVIMTSMEAACMNVSTFQAIIAAHVMMASCWPEMAIIVMIQMSACLTMEAANMFVSTQWEAMSVVATTDSSLVITSTHAFTVQKRE